MFCKYIILRVFLHKRRYHNIMFIINNVLSFDNNEYEDQQLTEGVFSFPYLEVGNSVVYSVSLTTIAQFYS